MIILYPHDLRARDLTPHDGTPLPVASLPYDLAAAITLAFQTADPAGFTAIAKDEAGDRAVTPYLVFAIKRGPLAYKSSTSTWHDDQVCLKVWADTGQLADDLLPSLRTIFDGVTLHFQTGATTAFVEADRGQGKGSNRAVGSKRVFWASIDYSVRTRTGLQS